MREARVGVKTGGHGCSCHVKHGRGCRRHPAGGSQGRIAPDLALSGVRNAAQASRLPSRPGRFVAQLGCGAGQVRRVLLAAYRVCLGSLPTWKDTEYSSKTSISSWRLLMCTIG